MDHETPAVDAAATFERHRADWPTVNVGGRRMDVDDIPGPDEL